MTMLAADWWESGSWWQFAITIAVALAVGALGAWAALRSANPKRKINWWVRSNTPLVNERYTGATPANAGGLAVNLGGFPLTQPRVVELVLANTGRRDITAAMFHANEPIRFEFDVEVCTLLDVTTTPTGSVQPALRTEMWRTAGVNSYGGTYLELPPSLLRRGQVVTATVLLNGEEKPVQCTSFPLVDVKVTNDALGSALSVLAESASFSFRLFGFDIPLGGRNR
ncbi:hypothetical protein [Streptomyces malaysiensis]|nr:hypothetical protein [Streptomyces malaysiensis]